MIKLEVKMRNCFLLLITIFALEIQFLSGDEKIGGTIENVDLIVSDLTTDYNHNYGDRYYAINRNDYPVRVSIKMINGVNAEDHLIRNTVIIEPHERADLGLIRQKDPLKTSDWKYEWHVKPDK